MPKLFELTLAMCFAVSAAACGGDSTADENDKKAEPLCDGSDGIRFLLTSGGGMVLPESQFTNPFGHSYLAVTGKCEAFVGENYMDGVRTVTLSTADADALAQDVRRTQVQSWKDHVDQGCPDAGRVSISDGQTFAWCSCGCDPDAPAGLEAAIDKAGTWRAKLWSEGTPLSGPVAAAADEDMYSQPGTTPLAWTLTWPITELPAPTSAAGKVVDDATDAAALRQLRADVTGTSYPEFVPVESGGARYRLFVRDELPGAVAAQLAALLGK